MTELVIGVRLKADGSGLATVSRQAQGDMAAIGAAAEGAAAGSRSLAAAQTEIMRQANAAAAAIEGMAADSKQAAGAAADLAREARQAGAAVDGIASAQRRGGKAVNDNTRELRAQQFAIRNVGQQFGDFGLQVASGQDPARAFGQQIGQVGYAMSELGGKAGAVGRFLVGPWGIALTVASAVLAPFVEKLFESGSASDDSADKLEKASQAADAYGTAQALLGKVIDLTTGKLKTQNLVLVESIRLQAQLNLLEAQKKIDAFSGKDRLTLSTPTPFTAGSNGVAFGDPSKAATADIAAARQQKQLDRIFAQLTSVVADDDLSAKLPGAYKLATRSAFDGAIGQIDKLAVNGKVAGQNLVDLKRKLIEIATVGTDKSAALDSIAALSGGPISSDLVPYKKDPKPKKPKKPKSTAGVEEFGRDAADRIAGITEQFNGTPALIDKIDGKVRQLDDLIEDLGRKKPPGFGELVKQAEAAKTVIAGGLIGEVAKAFDKPKTLGEQAKAAIAELDAEIAHLGQKKPPNFEQLIASAQAAKGVIQDALVKPVNDLLDSQEQEYRIGELILAGRRDEADVLRIQNELKRTGVTLSDDQRGAILSNIQALRAQNKEQEALQKRQQNLVGLTGNVRSSIVDALAGGSKDLGGAILDSFRRAFAEQITARFVDPILDNINDKITGSGVEKTAAGKFSSAIDTTINPLKELANAASQASGALAQAGSGPASSVSASDPFASDIGDIVVTGVNKASSGKINSVGGVISALLGAFLSPLASIASIFSKPISANIGTDSAKVFGRAAGGPIGAQVGNILGPQLSGFLGGALDIVGTGLGVAGLAKSIGLPINTGGAVGGALAGTLLAGPLGGVLGALGGGLLGSIFETKKRGVALVTNTLTAPTIGGNDSATKQNAAQLGTAVQDGLSQIAQTLGGVVGDFKVSIGTFDGKYRVSTTGFTGSLDSKAAKGQGLVDFGKDGADAAISYAIADAIRDGGVKGLSAAVQKALQSSTDINKAVAEAQKTQSLELLIGGVNAQVDKIFKDQDAVAADRVRIAKAYGLDLLKVEKANAEERAKLVADTLSSRVGSLQDFLTSVKTGDLFEGSASDRRSALLTDIATAQKEAEAGIDGAADRLSDLYRQLIDTSKDAFGTAGQEYAADRANAIAGVERVIQIETDRVNAAAAAQAAQTDALKNNNNLTNEQNDLLARLNSAIAALTAQLGGGGSASSNDGLINALTRQTALD